MKTTLRVIVLFICLNLLLVLFSFAFPGRLGFADKYQVAVQKIVIHQMEKIGSADIFHRKSPDPYTADAIQFSELTPYLEEINPGSLFFSDQGSTVSKLFIKDTWKHCGIYIGSRRQIVAYWGEHHDFVKALQRYYVRGDEYLIFDSSYDQGVAIYSIGEMADLADISTLRRFLVYEFTLENDDWSQALQSALQHIGKEYDYCFVLDDEEALYCSELLYKILPFEEDYFVPSAKIVGRESLLPLDLLRSINDKGVGSGAFMLKANISKEEGQVINHSSQ